MRERGGRSLPFVVRNEGDAVPIVRDHVGTLATIHADEGTGWDALHAGWDTRRVNHSVAFMDEGVCTNQAESYFSPPAPHGRSARTTTSPGRTSPAYASEASWREDNRRVANGRQAAMVARLRRWLRRLAGHGRGIGSGLSSVGIAPCGVDLVVLLPEGPICHLKAVWR